MMLNIMLHFFLLGLSVWKQTCVAAPAQQWSNRPKNCSSPNADEWDSDGVNVDTVSCKKNQTNKTATMSNMNTIQQNISKFMKQLRDCVQFEKKDKCYEFGKRGTVKVRGT